MRRAWYLGHSAADVGSTAVLVGDPDRVGRIARHLEAPDFLPVKRGLRTVTGGYAGSRVTVAAFGMGAPIATIVLHELAHLGVTRFVRIGTAMHFPPAVPGDMLISRDALSFEGTSGPYATRTGDPVADAGLVQALVAAAEAEGAVPRIGTFATFDAFYRDMFGIDDAGHARAAQTRAMLQQRGVLATDMETSALLTAAEALGVACATLCLGTVDGISQEKLAPEPLEEGEARMFRIVLEAITQSQGQTT